MKKRIFGFIAAFLAVILTFSATEALAGVKKVNGAPVYEADDKDNLLGIAADFGVFAKKIKFTGDTECNFACNELNDRRDIKPNIKGTIYIKNYNVNNGIDRFEASNKFYNNKPYLDVYFGYGYKVRQQGNQYFISGNNFWWERGFNFNDRGTITIEGATPFIDIDGELSRLEAVAGEIAGYAANGTEFDQKDMNNRTITCTAENNVLNIDYKDFAKYGQKITIKGLTGNNNTLIINILNAKGKEITIPQIYTDNNKSGDSTFGEASRILWNFGSFSGKIDNSDTFTGTILAPKAKVLVRGVFVGSVIAEELIGNQNEIHQVPPTIKKESEVTVTIRVLDGTCCDNPDVMTERLLKNVEFSLYKKNGKKYKKVVGSEKKTDDNANASWTIKEAGEYYIKETETIDGYVKSPSKCVFTVTKDADGTLKIVPKEGAKDGNGEVKYTKLAEDGSSVEYMKFRKYGDSLYMAAYIPGSNDTYELVSSDYKFKVNGKKARFQQGLEYEKDGEKVAYDIFESHINKAGRYQVTMLKDGGEIETKVVDAYLLPVGSYIFFEGDFVDLDEVKSNLGDYNIKKVTKSTQKYINSLRNEDFDLMTDGCVFFEVTPVVEDTQNDDSET